MDRPRSEVTLRFLAAPTDAGVSGRVPAGRVLEWIDKAGFACAAGWSGHYCVTAYVGHIRFTRPIEVGDLVEARAHVVHTGRTSMHIVVSVSSGPPATRTLTTATECLMVFVAVGSDGRPVPVPPWAADTPAAAEEQVDALGHVEVRAGIEAAMAAQTYSRDPDRTLAPRIVLRFLAAPTDVNWGGKVHGGIVMRWIDEAAQVLATSWVKGPSIAVYAGGVRFYRPLLIGHLVEVEARLIHTGRSSLHVSVHVRSGDPATGTLELTTHCLMVLVALDEEGAATPAPVWEPTTDEDRRLDAHALHLARLRTPLGGVRDDPITG